MRRKPLLKPRVSAHISKLLKQKSKWSHTLSGSIVGESKEFFSRWGQNLAPLTFESHVTGTFNLTFVEICEKNGVISECFLVYKNGFYSTGSQPRKGNIEWSYITQFA